MTDEELLTKYLETKDQELFAALHDRFHCRLRSLALRRLRGSESDADDVLQNVYLRLYQAGVPGSPIQSAESYLFRVVYNLTINHIRDSQSGVNRDCEYLEELCTDTKPFLDDHEYTGVLPNELNQPIDDDAKSPDERLETQELQESLLRNVHSLPPEQREAVETYYGCDLTLAETAEMLGVKAKTVSSRICRGVAALRETVDSEDCGCTSLSSWLERTYSRAG